MATASSAYSSLWAPRPRWLALSAVVLALAQPVAAQQIDGLVAYRADNRAGSAAAAAVIAEMIAERSQSGAVRDRARTMAPVGALKVSADELLSDIGANAYVAAVTGQGAIVPVALPAAAAPVAIPPAAPAVQAAVPSAPVVSAPVVPAVVPATSRPSLTRPGTQPSRNWGSGGLNSAVTDLGGGGGGGGGGSGSGGSGGGNGGGGGGGSGGGGWQ